MKIPRILSQKVTFKREHFLRSRPVNIQVHKALKKGLQRCKCCYKDVQVPTVT